MDGCESGGGFVCRGECKVGSVCVCVRERKRDCERDRGERVCECGAIICVTTRTTSFTQYLLT